VAFYRGAEACILVFDTTSAKSFENIETWKNDFIAKANPKDPKEFPFFLVGNKIDKVDDRKVIIYILKSLLTLGISIKSRGICEEKQ
jgi:Ras-related protein Rab-7A